MPAPSQSVEEPDLQTLEACRKGDREALEQVFRAQMPALDRFLGRLLGPDSDREDLLQLVLVAAMEAFPRFRGEASVRTWLAGIAVRVVQSHWRSPARRQSVSLDLVAEPSTDPGASPKLAEQREGVRRLYARLSKLTPKKRLAFSLHVLQGHSIAEVAAMMKASQSATKSRVFFARREVLRWAAKDPVLQSIIEEGAS